MYGQPQGGASRVVAAGGFVGGEFQSPSDWSAAGAAIYPSQRIDGYRPEAVGHAFASISVLGNIDLAQLLWPYRTVEVLCSLRIVPKFKSVWAKPHQHVTQLIPFREIMIAGWHGYVCKCELLE